MKYSLIHPTANLPASTSPEICLCHEFGYCPRPCIFLSLLTAGMSLGCFKDSFKVSEVNFVQKVCFQLCSSCSPQQFAHDSQMAF